MAVKTEQMYEGKAKKVFRTDDPDLVIVSYKDDATAFNGLKKGTIVGKGVVNNKVSNHMFKMLEKGEIDLLLHNHMRQIPGISAEFLMKDRLLFITPKNHLLNAYGIKSAKPYPWIDLSWFKNENFMLLPEAYTLREHAEQLFASLGWRPETIEIYTRTETILRLVTAGAGVGFIFESYLSYFNEERKPACFLIGNPPITVDYMAFYPEKMKQYPVFTRFLDMIRFVLSK